jgi:hypothetical protein
MDNLKPYLPKHPGILPYWLLIVCICSPADSARFPTHSKVIARTAADSEFKLSVVSIGNSFQAYTTTYYSKRIYCGPPAPPNAPPPKPSQLTRGFDLTRSPANELSARTFGTWTFLTSVVRLYAAYNIDNPVAYQLAIWTYAVAFMHFMSEWFYFGTTRWGAPLAGPAIVSTSGLVWMFMQWGHYVK